MVKAVRSIRHSVKRHQLRAGRFLAQLGLPDYSILTLFSLLMGMVAGFVGVGLHEVIDWISSFSFETPEARDRLGWFIVALPVAGMLLQYLMARLAPKHAEQKGVHAIIKAVGLRRGRIPFKTTLFHFIAPAICIGTGGTVGPEAPAAQSGAGAVSALGQLLGLSGSRLRVFTAAGAGAAIAAIFNTPLAGVFFAIEVVLLQDFKVSALSSFLLASVAASTVSRLILGNEPQFVIEVLQIGEYKYFVFFLLLGIGAGLVSVAFIRADEWIKAWYKKVYRVVPHAVGMAGTGLLMGLAGFWQPGILGIGYHSMDQILAGLLDPGTIALMVGLKFALVILILGAGGFGGVFAPSLFIGGGFGYLFAVCMSTFFGIPLDPATYTLVGMGAVLAGINSVPLTGIMILFEMTNDYHFILPLMLGVVGATLIVQMTLKGSIHARALEQEGYQYTNGRDVRVLESLPVTRVIREEILMVPENMTLAELIQECLEKPHGTIYTIDSGGKLNGVILPATLHQLIAEYEEVKMMVVAQDLADPMVPVLKDTDNLDRALRIFARARVDELPVVRQSNASDVLGTLHYQDILTAYNEATVKRNLMDDLAGKLELVDDDKAQEVIPGFSVLRIEVPGDFVDRTLKDLRLRNRFDIDVLMIEKPVAGPFDAEESQQSYPRINYRFKTGDHIIIFGKQDRIEAFRAFATHV